MEYQHVWNDRVAVTPPGVTRPLATYRYGPSLPKPCVHPLVTPLGCTLSGYEMSDHLWHRGLWFAIKFVGGANFWEENAPFGVQTSVAEPVCEFTSANTLRVSHHLEWTSGPAGVELRERRVVVLSPSSQGSGSIDWTSELRATDDLTLDRTPYTTWGGYGGLAFRGARELHDISYLLPGGERAPAVIGQSHPWVIMQSAVDGGANRRVSLGMIDHPANPAAGNTPWYCRSDPGYAFMNAAFLFHGPMHLARGDTLRLRYRVLYRDGVWDAADFARLAAAFRERPAA